MSTNGSFKHITEPATTAQVMRAYGITKAQLALSKEFARGWDAGIKHARAIARRRRKAAKS